jgi:hypothetical protein
LGLISKSWWDEVKNMLVSLDHTQCVCSGTGEVNKQTNNFAQLYVWEISKLKIEYQNLLAHYPYPYVSLVYDSYGDKHVWWFHSIENAFNACMNLDDVEN